LKNYNILNKAKLLYNLFIFAILSSGMLLSCGKDEAEIVFPRNYFSGVMDGTAFANTSIAVFKDTNDVFTFVGGTGSGISLIAFVNGKDLLEYPVTQGVLLDVSELLDQTVSLDSTFLDSIQSLITVGGNNLPVGESYAILIAEGSIYYSNRGSFTLTLFDGVANRIDGLIDFEMINIPNGPRYVQAFFEDVYYTDCPQIGICIL
jgi:hypothetical protein